MRPTFKIHALPANLVGLHTRYMNPGELDKLCALVNSVSARSFLEIGTNSGRTSLAVLRNCASVAFAWGIDVAMDYEYAKKVQARETPPRPGEVGLQDRRYRCLLSRYGSFDVRHYELPRFDAVFVDGDHSERGVRNDRALALAVGAKIIIYHDDNGRDVVDVTRTLDAIHKEERADIIHVEDSWLAFEVIK